MSFVVQKTLKNRRAAVIGSEPGGLAAAIALAVRGARVVVLERAEAPCTSLMPREVDGFRFQSWPPMLVNPRLLAQLFASAGVRLTDFVTLNQCQPACRFLVEGEKEPVDLAANPAGLARELARWNPADQAGVRRLAEWAVAAWRAHEQFRQTWPFEGRRTLLEPEFLRHGLPAMMRFGSAGRAINRACADPRARAVLHGLRAMSGLPPGQSAAWSLRHLGALLTDGGWTVEGGMAALRAAMLRLCQILGVKFLRAASVEKIELQGGRVKRLHGEGFGPLALSLVVSNVNSIETLQALLPGSEDSADWIDTLRKNRRAPSSMIMRLGCGRVWEQLAPLTVLPAADPRHESRFLDHWRLPCPRPTLIVVRHDEPDSTPAAGQSALTVRVEMPNLSSRFRWDARHVEEAEEIVMDTLERRGLTGLKGHVLAGETMSPDDLESMPSPDWGAGVSWRVDSLRALTRLPANRVAHVPGLYLASPSAFPGPGLDGAILGGLIAAVQAAGDAV